MSKLYNRSVRITIHPFCPKKPNKELKIHMQTCCTFVHYPSDMLEFLTFHELEVLEVVLWPLMNVWWCFPKADMGAVPALDEHLG